MNDDWSEKMEGKGGLLTKFFVSPVDELNLALLSNVVIIKHHVSIHH